MSKKIMDDLGNELSTRKTDRQTEQISKRTKVQTILTCSSGVMTECTIFDKIELVGCFKEGVFFHFSISFDRHVG